MVRKGEEGRGWMTHGEILEKMPTGAQWLALWKPSSGNNQFKYLWALGANQYILIQLVNIKPSQ